MNGKTVWDRVEQGGFPEAKELKQVVRETLAPSKDLGHSDSKQKDSDDKDNPPPDDDVDDEEAASMRAFYGVL